MTAPEEFMSGHPLRGRKVISFSNAMLGDIDCVVVDRWLQRAFKIDHQSSPTSKEYDQVENRVRYVAHAIGWEPRQISAAIWCSIRRRVYKDQKEYGYAIDDFERKQKEKAFQKEYLTSIQQLFSNH